MQREELRISREELRETRKQIRKQAEAATAQAGHTAAILASERRRSSQNYATEARSSLKQLLIDTMWHRLGAQNNDHLRYLSILMLSKNLAQVIERDLNDHTPIEQRHGTIRRFADHTLEITDLFDEFDAFTGSSEGDAPLRWILRYKDASHLYERCKRLQALADAAGQADD